MVSVLLGVWVPRSFLRAVGVLYSKILGVGNLDALGSKVIVQNALFVYQLVL